MIATGVVECAKPHRAEVYAKIELPEMPYPGREAVPSLAADACQELFEPFVGLPLGTSELNQFVLWPIEATWNSNRRVTCIVFDYRDVTGTLKGSDR